MYMYLYVYTHVTMYTHIYVDMYIRICIYRDIVPPVAMEQTDKEEKEEESGS